MIQRLANQRGQAAVEFALVLPILVFLLLAIMEGGRLFAGYIELQNVTRDGVRYAVVHPDVDTVAEITPYIDGRLAMLDAATLNVHLLRDHSPDLSDKWVELTLSYPMEIVTPIISDLIGNPVNLRVKMSMRSE